MSIFTSLMGEPEVSFIVQSTRQGSPSGSCEIMEPLGWDSASWEWKGPRTVPSVDEAGLGWSIESTRRERPRMSERRMNSCEFDQFDALRGGVVGIVEPVEHRCRSGQLM